MLVLVCSAKLWLVCLIYCHGFMTEREELTINQFGSNKKSIVLKEENSNATAVC
jgi:hypothetical protein